VEKKVTAEKLPRPEKAKRHPKPDKVEKKVKVEKPPKPAKADRHAGGGKVGSVEVVQVPPGEPAACSLEPRTGHLVLQIPRARDGAPGPQGPRGLEGHQGPQGVPGTTGEPGAGIDYSKAPGGKEDFFLFIDRNGRLCYSSLGEVALVNLILTPPPGEESSLSD
jgi:hypothetical protein